MVDPKRAAKLIREHFDNLTTEQFLENLKSACPEVFEEEPENESIDLEKDDLSPEYDFSKLTFIAKNQELNKKPLTVQIDPELSTIFPDSAAVNEGLRLLMRLINNNSSQPN
ncbi:MAG: hypothetical protein AB4058_01985 [Microcystaceae cyanobacterium]